MPSATAGLFTGPVSPIATRLMQTTRESLFEAVEQVRAGNHLGDVSAAVQRKVEGVLHLHDLWRTQLF